MKSLFFKIVFFSLVSVYVFTTVGVCVIAHYCGGELEKVSLFSKTTSCCDGEDNETDDCCKDEGKHVTFQSDFTFYKLIHDCKASVNDLFMLLPSSLHFSLEKDYVSFFSTDQKVHPPNLVQHEIVDSSVIRV
ncbi:MAG: hypothetical protein V4580_14240 [Bacteroidota bacterium]